jgi:hypothetical protein
MKRAIVWFLLNGGMTACAIYGLYYHVVEAKNLLLFLVWATAIINTVGAMSYDVKVKLRKKGRSVPVWLAVTNDLIIMAALASVGMFLTASSVLWQMICETAIYEGNDETKSGQSPDGAKPEQP